MAANGGTDIIDHNLTIEVWELLLNQISNCTGIIIAGGHGDKALAIVIMAALGVVLHLLYDLLDDSLFAADLLTRNEMSLIIHIQQRADLQRGAKPTGRLGNATAADIEGQIGRKEPVV